MRGFNTFNRFPHSTFDGCEMKCEKLNIVHQNQIGGDRGPKKKKKVETSHNVTAGDRNLLGNRVGGWD